MIKKSNPAINLEQVGKKYFLGRKNSYTTFADKISEKIQNLKNFRSDKEIDFWALKDISLRIEDGEIIGVIGKNGSGKSTLLKILSRITSPSEGKIFLKGKIGSLLEVGTGFHPELTGLENIYLNGSIMGMKKKEINDKCEDIIKFSEIEKFLNTPVKRYSSGMYIRLAFSVAAHLDPNILLVDEVLAVGDINFQKKCLGKMGQISKEGRTVLFVSHNMAAIHNLCEKAILLDQGSMIKYSEVDEVIEKYLNNSLDSKVKWERKKISDGDIAFFKKIFLANYEDKPIESISTSTKFHVVIEFIIKKKINNLHLGFGFLDQDGEEIFGSYPQDSGITIPNEEGHYCAKIRIPEEILAPRQYGITVSLFVPNYSVLDYLPNVINFTVKESASIYNATASGRKGKIVLKCQWNIIKMEKSGNILL